MQRNWEERRKLTRAQSATVERVRISVLDGTVEAVEGRVLDRSRSGLGIEMTGELPMGSKVRIQRLLDQGPPAHVDEQVAAVAWCLYRSGEMWLAGLSFHTPEQNGSNFGYRITFSGEPAPDYYEVMQLSPRADLETIHRVYRILAQRYHPDNRETANEEMFKNIVQAYQVLSDPQRRAGYDSQHATTLRLRWKMFDQPEAAVGFDEEKSKRQGVLSLLYTKRMRQPDHPAMVIAEMEELLGCPREHLEFTLWFLKENHWIVRSDNGRYSITAAGVVEAEKTGLPCHRPGRMLTDGAAAAPPN